MNKMPATVTVTIEERAYGPESSEEEIRAIKERVYLYAEDIIMLREVPIQSIFQLDLFEEKLNEIARGLPSYRMLIDLIEAKPPSAEVRVRLKKLFSAQDKMRNVAVFTGRNFMLNVAAKFVLSGVGLRAFSVHKTLTDALKAIGYEPTQ